MSIPAITSLLVTADTSGNGHNLVSGAPATSSSVAQQTIVGADVATSAPSPARVDQAVKQVNDAFIQNGQNLYALIEKDKASGIVFVKVYDNETEDVVSQFPLKAMVAIADAISQSNGGKVQLMHVSA